MSATSTRLAKASLPKNIDDVLMAVSGESVVATEEITPTKGNPSVESELDAFTALLTSLNDSNDVAVRQSREDVVADLLNSGKAKLYKNVHVLSASLMQSRDASGSYQYDANGDPIMRVLLRTDGRIPAYKQKGIDPDTRAAIYGIGYDDTIRLSIPRCAQGIASNSEYAIFEDDIRVRPAMINVLYSGSVIDILAEFIPAGSEWRNPFANGMNMEANSYSEDTIRHHVVAYKPGKNAQRVLDKRFDAFATMASVR